MNLNENEQKISTKTIQLVSFTVGEEEYGVHIEDVQEIVRMPEITHLPQTPDFIKGVINLRGNIIPVIDMRERFNMKAREYTSITRVIVIKIEKKLVGMIVDAVSQVLVLNEDDIDEAPDIIHGISKEFIEGIGKVNDDLIIILDIQKVLTAEEIKSIKMVTKEIPDQKEKK
ncbi:MAG: chemotaxis protein CheW [bacterium]|nr:chemotaxis protein CheW [bacterium]